ncbi:hypothetical protein [Yoonia sp. 2307UL14-13]|uniref:hypothetical protein n=1 Tax=Yoonia sp. 2307UL14-13 TaxID=3126506 RepID=UPI00309BF55E
MTSLGKFVLVMGATGLLAACEGRSGDSIDPVDAGIDGGPLADGVASIWVSPDGCQYWYIDDGIEGYMAARLNRDGTPRCTAAERGESITTKGGGVIQGEPEPVR